MMSKKNLVCTIFLFTQFILPLTLADDKHHDDKPDTPRGERHGHSNINEQAQPQVVPQMQGLQKTELPTTNSRDQIRHIMKQRGMTNKVRVSPREKGQAIYERNRQRNWTPIQRQEAVKRVGDHLRTNHPERSTWFNDKFFSKHHLKPYYHHHGHDWWRRPRWVTINNWLPYGWSYPIDYSEGYPEEVPLEIYGYPPEPEDFPPEQVEEWLPLGIFATGRNVNDAVISNIFMQLAVNRTGDMAGTYYNSATNLSYLIEGVVDQETQQAAWRLAEASPAPLMVTGIYNLSQDVVPTVVYNPDGSAETWVLIRVDKGS